MKKTEVKLILVTHLLPDRPNFLKALSKIVDVALIIPKPKTIDKKVLNKIKKYPICRITRDNLGNKGVAIDLIKKHVGENYFVISDIGGYFARPLNEIKTHFKTKFLGVVEDTENGFQKYESLKEIPCPIFSVARSPLKKPEDTLIAYSTVYSAERILRERDEVLNGKKALVIGYGKIGSCITKDLSRKQVRVRVYDNDPIKLVQACSEGYNIVNKSQSLKNIDLIFAVTGNQCLDIHDLLKLNKITYIFSITSSDDEFKFNKLTCFKKKSFSNGVILIKGNSQIYLVNNGNAVNFLHGAVVGNFICLVQAEIIFSILKLISKQTPNGFLEIDNKIRKVISKKWLKAFI